MRKVAVLSRYKETNESWTNTLRNYGYEVVIYNKYYGDNLISNVGREGHTYIKYIIDNYHNLPDEILFSQYDPLDHLYRRPLIVEKQNSGEIFLNSKILDFVGINPTDYDLFVRGRQIDWNGYSKIAFENFTEKDLYSLIAIGSTLNGVFRVTKNAVLRHSIETYNKCLNMLSGDSNPIEGFYFERIWKYMFMRTGCLTDKYKQFNNKIFLFGLRNKSTSIIDQGRKFTRQYNNYGHIKLFDDGNICSNGMVSYYTHPNESHWMIEDDCLYIMNSCGALTSKYDLNLNDKEFAGDFWDIEKLEWNNGRMLLSEPMWIKNFSHTIEN